MVVDGDLVCSLNDKIYDSVGLDRNLIRDEEVNVPVEWSQIRTSVQWFLYIRSPRTKSNSRGG